MKGYLRDRQAQEKVSRWTGVGLTVAVHVIVVLCFVFSGFRYVWPPPQEKILIAFEDIDDLPLPEKPPVKRGDVAAEEVDLEKPVEEVVAAQSPLTSSTRNDATAANPTENGDVEIPKTPETPLDPKAVFPGHSKRDTSNTSQGAKNATDQLTPGQVNGGPDGATDGTANAHVSGWSTSHRGKLQAPRNKKGTVVIDIWIDDSGRVTDAKLNAAKSTTLDKELTDKAIKAAKECTFRPIPGQEQKRTGTVTCNFNLE